MLNYLSLENVVPGRIFNELIDITTKYNINNILRLAHFLSQCSYESTNFTKNEENLNYSAKRLSTVFRKYFPTEDLALIYAKKPIKIGSKVYAGRMGNGTEESLDGWTYRGRGFIQLTGKDNYRQLDKELNDNIIANPDLVASKYPLISAAWYWNHNKLNETADQGASENEVALITKKINGGFNGLEDRTKLFNLFYSKLKQN